MGADGRARARKLDGFPPWAQVLLTTVILEIVFLVVVLMFFPWEQFLLLSIYGSPVVVILCVLGGFVEFLGEVLMGIAELFLNGVALIFEGIAGFFSMFG